MNPAKYARILKAQIERLEIELSLANPYDQDDIIERIAEKQEQYERACDKAEDGE